MTQVADVLRLAANVLENRDRSGQRGDPSRPAGGDAFAGLHHAARDLYGGAAVVAVERFLKVEQLQHVKLTADELAAEMRKCADAISTEEAVDAQVTALLAELESVRDRLAAVLDVDSRSYDLEGCLQSIEGDYRMVDIQAARAAYKPGQEWPVPKPVRRSRRPVMTAPVQEALL